VGRFLGWVTKSTNAIALVGVLIPTVGLLAMLIYTGWSNAFGVAVLTALSAGAIGLLLGLLFGVPREVSSGAFRQSNPTPAAALTTGDGAAADPADLPPSTPPVAGRFATSTNLAEVSDWLTKLLLGAGLVSLTKIGAPLGHMIDTVAAGLTTATGSTGSATVAAGAIMFGYGAIGFLDGYFVTTLWYQKELNKYER
jgi:hypothetical protein